jgi:spermidine/putrescine-binding protein
MGRSHLQLRARAAPQLYQRGILEPLAWSEAPNAAAIYPEFRKLPQIGTGIPGKVVGFPFSWGYQGFIRTAKLPRMTSWKQIFDPNLKGRIVGVNDPTTSIATMALVLGYKDYAHLTKAQLDTVMNGWKRLRPSLRTIVSDYGAAKDLLVRGEIDGCIPGWQAMVIWAGKDGKTLYHDIPKEGVYGFLDLLCLIKGSKNPQTAKNYINFMLSPQAQAHLSADLSQGITSSKAVPLLSRQLRGAYQYASLATNFKRSPIRPLPSNSAGGKYVSYADWADAWDRFTAG